MCAATPASVARRACLSVPGDSERMLEKAAALDVDEVVIDLEDAVAPEAKPAARELTLRALGGHDWTPRLVSVRVNGLDTPWARDDVATMAKADRRPDSLVLPKVESPGDLELAGNLLAGAELRVQALIETARGLAYVREIADSSDRLVALIIGFADLGASLGGERRPADWAPAQHDVLVAARAHGLQAIDGPFLAYEDEDGLRDAAARAARLGMDGKWAIHPQQVGPIVEAFTPSDDEIEKAKAILDGLAAALSEQGRGVVSVDGLMVDEAVRIAAERTLERAGAGR